MKRFTVITVLIIAFAGLATASNGQEAILEKEIEEILLINSQIQGNLDRCGNDGVCIRLSSSAEERAGILDTIDNAPEDKERGILKQVRESIRGDIALIEEQDLSEDRQLSRVLELGYDLEKSSNRALRASNTLSVISTAKDCPEKCGPEVSDEAQEAKDLNSSRSNKPRS